jgi:hypothetical protein
MNDDLTSIKKETLNKCISVTDSWEKKQAKVTEGPSLLKKGNTYYLYILLIIMKVKIMRWDMQQLILLKDLGLIIVEIRFSGGIRGG